MIWDLIAHLRRQQEFSARAFGPGPRIEGILDHIEKESAEVWESGGALHEWIDVILLGLDGAWRSGATPEQICDALGHKLAVLNTRQYPDWRTAEPGKAIEHIRDGE